MTMAPRSVAPMPARLPLKLPSGVLTALTMTASFIRKPQKNVLSVRFYVLGEGKEQFKEEKRRCLTRNT
jgi:hypothetical protein